MTTVDLPRAWIVVPHHKDGWRTRTVGQVFTSYDEATDYAKRRAVQTPEMDYVIFASVGSWRAEAGPLIEGVPR